MHTTNIKRTNTKLTMFSASGTSPPKISEWRVTFPVTEMEVGAMLPLSPGHVTVKPTLLMLSMVSVCKMSPESVAAADHDDTSSRNGVI